MRERFMSDFEKYWEENASKESWANKAVAWSIWKEKQAIIDEHTEVIKIQDADLRKYEKQIESLKAQLNNMEACYIEKKKECEDQHKKVDEVLEYLDGESANRWGLWKEKADMLDQGASNAFEEAYWMVKKALR